MSWDKVRGALRQSKRRLLLKRRPPAGSIVNTEYMGSHFLVFPHEAIGWDLISKREFEHCDLTILLDCIESSDRCVDIGANIGLFSCLMAQNACEVTAFEPIESNRKMIRMNCVLNDLENVTVVGRVMNDSPGELEFTVASDSAFSSLASTGRVPDSEKLIVEATTLDLYFKDRFVDVLKIDVEGAEKRVLDGGKELFGSAERAPRLIFIELSSDNLAVYGTSPVEVIDLLQSHDYKAFNIDREENRLSEYVGTQDSENMIFMKSTP